MATQLRGYPKVSRDRIEELYDKAWERATQPAGEPAARWLQWHQSGFQRRLPTVGCLAPQVLVSYSAVTADAFDWEVGAFAKGVDSRSEIRSREVANSGDSQTMGFVDFALVKCGQRRLRRVGNHLWLD